MILAAIVAGTLAGVAPGQRAEASFTLGDRTSTIEYGVPRYGHHSLDELAPNTDWRLGCNEATTWRLESPIVVGDDLVAPGHYRLKLRHEKAERFLLRVEGATDALGGESGSAWLPGRLRELDAATGPLRVEFPPLAPKERKRPAVPVELGVSFGPHRVDVPFTVVQAWPARKLRGFALYAYKIPAELFDKRLQAAKPVSILSLHPRKKPGPGEPAFFNLVVGEKTAQLLPALRASSSPFGPPMELDKAWAGEVTLEWSDVEREEAAEVLEVTEATRKKNEIRVGFACGQRTATAVFAVPAKKE